MYRRHLIKKGISKHYDMMYNGKRGFNKDYHTIYESSPWPYIFAKDILSNFFNLNVQRK